MNKNFQTFLFILFCTMISVTTTSCNNTNDEPEVEFEDVTLVCGKSYTIANGNEIEWTSSNKYIASVVGNVVTAERIGEATISSSKGSFKVSVKGTTGKIYFIPCIDWGVSKNTVKNFMSDYTLEEEDYTTLTYSGGSESHLLTMYDFEYGGLSSSTTALNGNYIDSDGLMDFITERYVPITMDEESYTYYFITTDNKTLVALGLRSLGNIIVYAIAYAPRNEDTRSIDNFNWLKFEQLGYKSSDLVKDKFEQMKLRFIK